MARDFRATQIETRQLILTGGISGKDNLGAIVYSGSVATDRSGGIPASMLTNVGTDVFLFISGNISNNGPSPTALTLLGGDTVASGTLSTLTYSNLGGNNLFLSSSKNIDLNHATSRLVRLSQDNNRYFHISYSAVASNSTIDALSNDFII